LQYSRARWYDATIGRFISEDPIGFAGGDVNLYGYVGNNPLQFTDPFGKYPNESPDDFRDLRRNGFPDPNGFPKSNISCDYKDYNPWIGGEVGGGGHLGFIGYSVSGGVEVNVLTGQICLFVKSTPRIGLGLFAGVGLKGNLDLQERTQTDGWSTQPELAIDVAIAGGGKVDLRGGKFVKLPKYKGGFSGDMSSSGVGIGIGPDIGLGAGVGVDFTMKRVWCFNKPPECECKQK
jgi:hypothetical protein